MPEGIYVEVDSPFVRVSFPDTSKKGTTLKALFDAGAEVQVFTGGPRRVYVTDEESARTAGLLDDVVESDDDDETTVLTPGDDSGAGDGGQTPPEPPKSDLPNGEWTRKDIDAYGAALTPPIDTTGAGNKADALALLGIKEEN